MANRSLLSRFLSWSGVQGPDGIMSLTVLFALVVLVKFALAPSLDWVAILPLALPLLAQGQKRSLNYKSKSQANAEDLEAIKIQLLETQKVVGAVQNSLDPEKIQKLSRDVQVLTEAETLRRLKGGR